MNLINYTVTLALIFGFFSCNNENKKEKTTEITENRTSDLQVDHLNIWVKNPTEAKKRITDIGFKSVPDSLSGIHNGQGTSGRYFYFLNGYLELIFVYDQKELEENNKKNKYLDFTERANFDKNEASPFSVALKVKDYKTEKIPFEKVAYHQNWMEENASIFSAKNSKTHLKEPSIFVVYPEIESDTFESLSDLENYPTEDDGYWKAFFKHPNGAKKITNILITSPDIDITTQTIKAVNGIKDITIQNGSEHMMELYFDNNVQGKSYDLRPELPLILHL